MIHAYLHFMWDIDKLILKNKKKLKINILNMKK